MAKYFPFYTMYNVAVNLFVPGARNKVSEITRWEERQDALLHLNTLEAITNGSNSLSVEVF